MKYLALSNQSFSRGKCKIVPLRDEDRYEIMKWRNEQIYHLRQHRPLTKEDQDNYFSNVVANLFIQPNPNQILFSFLHEEKCIGYGGLVHINWIDRNAEISFIIDTSLERDFFEVHWKTFLSLIEEVAFIELQFHKIFTFAFDLRPNLYKLLESNGFEKEAVLKEHSYFDGQYINVVIHSKLNLILYLRDATADDLQITHNWANQESTRKYAFNQDYILFQSHQDWFLNKIESGNCIYKILVRGSESIGLIRLDIAEREGLISYLVSPLHVGHGYGIRMLQLMISEIKNSNSDIKRLKGLVKKLNVPSVRIFEKLSFKKRIVDNDIIEFKLDI